LRILGKSDREIEELTTKGAQINPESIVQAPIGGTVIARKVSPGQYIQSSASDPVFIIGDLSTVWLVANLRESDISHVRLGAALTVRVLALPDMPLQAKIIYISPSVDPATRRLSIRAEVGNPGFLLKPEMFASFTIVSGDEEMRVAVPQSAIVYEGAAAHVWVAGKNRSISSRPIAPGRSEESLIEVLSGLEAGEEVVTSGALFIDRAAQSKSSFMPIGISGALG
jgi:cobalt-zinc-cadmium efflux system membrane fusion protein